MPTKISWPDVQWRVRTEDAEAFGWLKEETVCVITMPCCGFAFLATHTDADGDAYTCPPCEPKEMPEVRA